MTILLIIFIGGVIGFFMNQLLHDKTARFHIDIIAGAIGAPLGLVISSPFGGDDIGSKISSFVSIIVVSIVAVFVSRIAKL